MPKVKDADAKKLEDYQPGANRALQRVAKRFLIRLFTLPY